MSSDGAVQERESTFDRALELIQVYRSCLARPAFREVGRRENLILRAFIEQALSDDYRAELERRLTQAQHYKSIVQCPIIGIVGQLNAGKSTVLSMFLSREGRARVPRGLADSMGTHRFVYWVPQAWLDNDHKREALFDLLRAAHGEGVEPEALPEDPREAEEVYRSGRDDPRVFTRPVIAGDENLNRLNAGFLDTPDVQTDDESGEWRGHKSRLDLVGEAAALCSAILFVVDYSYLRDARMKKFFDLITQAVSKVPLFFLLNKVEPNESSLQAQLGDSELRRYQDAFRGLYVAYNYRIERWKEHLPDFVRERAEAEWEGDGVPFFFAVCPDRKRPVEPVESLRELPRKLTWGRLQRERAEELGEKVIQALQGVSKAIDDWRERRRERLEEIQEKLLQFCVRQFKSEDGYQVPLNPKFLEEANEAMRRTAPWWAKIAVGVQGKLREWVKGSSARQWIEKTRTSATEAVQKATGADPILVRSKQFAEQMQEMRWVGVKVDSEELARGWDQVFRELEKLQEEFAYDKEELDRIAREIWKGLPLRKKLRYALANAAPIMLLLSVLDGGLTAAGIWTWLTGHLPGTLLLLGAVASSFVGKWKEPVMRDTSRYVSILYYLACDVFGLARPRGSARVVDRCAGDEIRLLSQEELPLGKDRLPMVAPIDPDAGLYEPLEGYREFESALSGQPGGDGK